ncbi:MAG: MiaB/RimO family radical SAM methylthiotransferase [Actinomycetota bacterium]
MNRHDPAAPTDVAEPTRAGQSYVVKTYGCQMNEHDSERISGMLESDGMHRVDDVADADVIVLNTCCIRENADNKLYGALGHLKALKEQNPNLQIAVGGCLAQKDRGTIRDRAGHVDVVFGTHNVHRAVELLDEAKDQGPIVEILEAAARDDQDAFPSALPARREVDHAGWLTIQIGCDNNCAFCIVPAVRGPELSRPFGELVQEARDLADDGVSEITLLGQNVNSYGRDLALARRKPDADATHDDRWWCGERWLDDRRARPLFGDLLREVGAIEGVHRVRYTSPHPKDMRAETFAAMAETPEVCEHLHFPLQSGSDAVLSAMHRGYTGDRYLEKLREARATIPDLAVSTDIIVGFPGETDDDFERTLEIAAAAEYESAFTFVFSPRPGTEAAELLDTNPELAVPHPVAVERYERLRLVIERSSMRANQARIGRIEEVTVEGPSKKDPSVLTGRTRRNTLIHFPSPTRLKAGTYAEVKVTDARANHLLGELIEVTIPARHRTRIPVTAG